MASLKPPELPLYSELHYSYTFVFIYDFYIRVPSTDQAITAH